ncbi:MAG TPA: hypothetical protein VK031_00920 [Tissierellaceae bacterium]|nr:hypothetical protein [Tissierellaceae bacterium]
MKEVLAIVAFKIVFDFILGRIDREIPEIFAYIRNKTLKLREKLTLRILSLLIFITIFALIVTYLELDYIYGGAVMGLGLSLFDKAFRDKRGG